MSNKIEAPFSNEILKKGNKSINVLCMYLLAGNGDMERKIYFSSPTQKNNIYVLGCFDLTGK